MAKEVTKVTEFWIEQGMQNPTTKEIGWRYWSDHPNRNEAESEWKNCLYKRGGLWRMIKVEILKDNLPREINK